MRLPRVGTLVAAAAVVSLSLAGACSAGGEPGNGGTEPVGELGVSEEEQVQQPEQRKELPGGGTRLFPDYRIVGYAGIEGTGPVLGKLGVGDLDDRMQEVVEVNQKYSADGQKVMPVAEFIATVVHGAPGEDGMYRGRASDAAVQKHLDAVRKVDGMLLLAIQPGRSDFLTETKYYEKFLKEPDVGVALDPEWRMGPDEIPMKTFGHVTGKELNDTALYLQQVVEENNLPEKVMLYHQLRVDIVRETDGLKPHDGVVQIVSVDGIGDRDMKVSTWNAIIRSKPKHVYPGFKLFYMEDGEFGPIMTPEETLGLTPTPFYVLYE